MTTKEALAEYRKQFRTLELGDKNPDYVPNGHRWNWDDTWDRPLWETIFALEAHADIEFIFSGVYVWSMLRRGKIRIGIPETIVDLGELAYLVLNWSEVKKVEIARQSFIYIDVKLLQREIKSGKRL
jgi:hypothetical protein